MPPRRRFRSNRDNRQQSNENRNNLNVFRQEGRTRNGPLERISLKRVNELLEKESDEIILSLISPPFGLDFYLNADRMGEQLIYKFTKLIEKGFQCYSMKYQLINLIEKIKDSNFFTKILYQEINRHQILEGYNKNLIESVINICCTFLHLFHQSTISIQPIKDRLHLIIVYNMKDPELIKRFEELDELDREAANNNEKNSRTFTNIDVPNDLEPPNNFTEMSVVPTLADILNDQVPFLRKNVTNGAYNSVHHYLDVQFRLLREDFLCPLRLGITRFRDIIKDAQKRKVFNPKNGQISKDLMNQLRNIESLSIYFSVVMDRSQALDQGIVYSMKLGDKSKSINWENSKKLMFGSLVCFSSDYFQTECIIGVICERHLDKLKKDGLIYVRFDYDLNDTDMSNVIASNNVYVMLETSAYFESYKHVLEALISFARIDENDFPFRENLIKCQNKIINAPEYLKNACFDFRPIMNIPKRLERNRLDGSKTYNFLSNKGEKCFLANKESWPTAEDMNLDESQYKAVQLALQSKLALIQGPPGTGKTFIGVKIVQLLLHNKHIWWNKPGDRHKPILMICYTNHALDQFLEYCINESNLFEGVVRVGGRSKSKNLEPFLLSTIKSKFKKEHKIERDIFLRIKDEIAKLQNLKDSLNKLNDLLVSLFNGDGILNYETIENYMRPDHIEQFDHGEYLFIRSREVDNLTYHDYMLIKWLGLFDIDSEDANDLTSHLEKLKLEDSEEIETENQTFEEDENDIGSDNDSMNEERMLEDDFEFNDLIKKNNNKKNIAAEMQKNKTKNSSSLSEKLISFAELENLVGSNKSSKWKTVRRRRNKIKNKSKVHQFLTDHLHYANNYPKDDLLYIEMQKNIWKLDIKQKFALYFTWLNKFKIEIQDEIKLKSKQFNECATKLRELRLQEDRSIMQNALIIAMTTTGSSRYHNVLKDIGPRIVIVEEAAEVFEAHIVSSLSKKCEHLILIGDHVQLRPNPTVFKLAKDYHLDVSLFERLINNDSKKVMLNCQHRMRPEISVLMKFFYDEKIDNHESVNNFSKILGLDNNIYFINHKQLEVRIQNDTSKINEFEAQYLSKLCQYFLKQKYPESSITILSMYLGQMMEIKRRLKLYKIKDVKVSTVDNYQGEENDIILLSLVRSNNENKIGFLDISNRVCVALSRAKKGFYCIGNFDFICKTEKNNNWTRIVNELKKNDLIGNSLRLTCGSHRQNDIEASDPLHFDLRPNGGCQILCNFRLKCGHSCSEKCHLYDKEHIKYNCRKACEKIIPKCGHKCLQICSHSDKCFKCSVLVDKKIIECGHAIKFRCDTEPTRRDCKIPCTNVLSCGHICTKYCKDIICEPCETLIQVVSPCDHKTNISVPCKQKEYTYSMLCSKKCNKELKCGHLCKSKCGECFNGLIHKECSEDCKRVLICGHLCSFPCAKQCRPCEKKCENKCPHSKCPSKCCEPCVPCREQCKYKCEHYTCNKLCSEQCDRPACNQPCKKKLKKCGHQCIGICGEPCPKYCRICDKDFVSEIFFGNEDEANARFILLKDCNHIIESSGMDHWIESRYGANGSCSNSISLPECPKCKTIIRLNLRYSNYIRKQLESIEQIKIKQFGDSEENEMMKQKLIKDINDLKLKDFYSEQLFSDLSVKTITSHNQIASYENSWNIYKKLLKLEEIIYKNFKDKQDLLEILIYEKDKIMCLLNQKHSRWYRVLTNQQMIEDILAEIDRINNIIKYYEFKNAVAQENSLRNPIEVGNNLAELEKILVLNNYKFQGEIKEKTEKLFNNLKKYVNLDYTEEERVMIIKAIGLKQGHWFRCSCGFLYCIGECGGAMQKTKCPNCDRIIGGENHALNEGSRLASDFDGSQYAAWSDTANNMNNWNLDD